MARGKSLVSLLDDLRAETRASLNPAHNVNVRDTQIKYLNRAMEWLWEDFNWPHLRVERMINCQAGQRYYGPPDDILIDRIMRIEIRYGLKWLELEPWIDTTQNYSMFDSDTDVRSWPIRRWRIIENEMFEVWPIPASDADTTSLDGVMKVFGIKNIDALVNDTDTCPLDSRLVVMFAASDMLAASGSKDAPLKQQEAQRLYSKLRGKLMTRRKFTMFGKEDVQRNKLRGPPPVYYRIVS